MQTNEESLSEMAYRYFMRKGFEVNFNVNVKSEDGKKQNVDLMLTNKAGDKTGVLVVNWGRSIGVNVVRKLSGIMKGANLKEGILIGKDFSEHGRKFANDYEVQLLSKSRMQFDMDEL